MSLKVLQTCAVMTLLTVPAFAQEKNQADTYRLLNLFGDVFERVRGDYVEPVSDQELIEQALNGMLQSMDPHSAYLNAKTFKDMQVQTKGEFGGLGIEVTMEGGWIKVVSPIDDTPAHKAGVRPSDFITHLDGESVMGLSLNEAVERMRGAPNTPIKLTIRRAGKEPFDLTLNRAVIKIQPVRQKLEGDIAVIRVTSFNEQTNTALKKAISDVKVKLGRNPKGFVLDLRNNPGGLLDQAVAVSDDFLDQGEIVSTRSRKPEETQRFNARRGDAIDGAPLVVLINEGSASASEIVAGALQDHKRATLIGTKSFGKGSVQTIIPLPGYGAIKLTTAKYYTPSGRSIQQVGIEPDIEVKTARDLALQSEAKRGEASLPHALKNETVGEPPAPSKPAAKPQPKPSAKTAKPSAATAEDKDEGAEEDVQLKRALEFLRGKPAS
ncbi:MAG: PDZ domain-containing protein [Rhodospirillales bacterium]|jgi:carboxyl-terminal processing protease|nr:PDZ domain-containing protein [Rhodospirillales bacterium]